MKKFLLLLLLSASLSYGQSYELVDDEKSGKQVLIGIIDRSMFADTLFYGWFEPEYKNYEVNLSVLEPIIKSVDNITVTTVLGTWCSDSREQVPRFLKILDVLQIGTPEKLILLGVDRNKQVVGDESMNLNIKAVPTFIILRDNEEIGRIVETPVQSLEQDLVNILTGSTSDK